MLQIFVTFLVALLAVALIICLVSGILLFYDIILDLWERRKNQ